MAPEDSNKVSPPPPPPQPAKDDNSWTDSETRDRGQGEMGKK